MYDGKKALAANVINKAISDYKRLLEIQKKEKLDEEQKERIQRGIKENEIFFKSEWAENLAEFVSIKFSPEKLIEKLRSEV